MNKETIIGKFIAACQNTPAEKFTVYRYIEGIREVQDSDHILRLFGSDAADCRIAYVSKKHTYDQKGFSGTVPISFDEMIELRDTWSNAAQVKYAIRLFQEHEEFQPNRNKETDPVEFFFLKEYNVFGVETFTAQPKDARRFNTWIEAKAVCDGIDGFLHEQKQVVEVGVGNN